MGWKFYDEAIEMLEQRFKYLPKLFRWRGRYYEVDAVDRCWTLERQRKRQRLERRYFRVQCGEGTFELYQDLVTATWHLRRARVAPVRAQEVQRLAPAWR
jgi:hypothetical protein